MVDDVLKTLEEGKMDVSYCHCKKNSELETRLGENPPDLIIADFDAPDHLKKIVQKVMEPYYSEVPLIYLVGEKNQYQAAETMKAGVWDYVSKDQLFKLIPSVYSSRKYSQVNRQRREAERALGESRDRYMSIFQSVNDGILLFDFKTRKITDYNPRVLELFGVTDADMEVLEIDKFSCTEEGFTIDRAREYIEEAVRGNPVSFEWRNITKEGRKFWTLNSFSIVRFDKKKCILLVTRNIDAQKKMEQSLLESQEHFRALAENSPDVIMRFDRNHRHVYVNNAVVGQTGLQIDAFINKSHREMGIFPEEKVRLWEEALDRVFQTGQPHTLVFEIELDDHIHSYEWRLYPEIGSSELVDSVIGVARDITDNMESEDALKRSEERLNLALQATELGLWDWNVVTNEVYYSPIWMSMLGYGPDELPQELDTWTSLQHPDDAEESMKKVQQAIRNREDSFEIEFRLKYKNGNYVWIRAMGKAVGFDEQGNTTRLTGIHENIDERKKDELVRQVLFDISNAVSTTQSLDELYVKIRESLGHCGGYHQLFPGPL